MMNVENTISTIVKSLKQINGITALVLGGSRARGTESPNSDIDIGIYYNSEKGLDIAQLRQIAAVMDDERRENAVTEIGEWGPWINGGGWLKVNQTPVDFLYRDLNRVSTVLQQCHSGELTIDYQPGHPHGFVNSIYFAEIALCKVLWDPSGTIGEMKARTIPYPSIFQKTTIQNFFWEASFSLENGYKGIHKKDFAYVAGCCFRSVSCLNQVMFAMNEAYLMNEKGAAAIADSFDIVPSNYSNRINELFSLISENQEGSREALSILRDLIQETETLLKKNSLEN